ncbi:MULTISPECIES: hypothetical protein [Streptomyces]|uniref:Lipoprotein n=1 Tax=Streptomyces thermoviolaceus subsp. thermoviolaceus TaxID=66860 RepID=A0ABX0YUF9_STRTL|nr:MULTISPECIES: hypothetical protein [Streptomyces]MCM3263756.1 hypothetical protein [Streptomyces thermoviolaceus]NJP14675.1 hypothetical protein [Streptomyces thermoviolaceus subsp. thermoviolaceus]RSS07428.1 hypothetical protein EF917_05010 [Streptomyces sp. WAC00469]WTD47780.1 hypothetical protein OG899_09730 [Streptomyces thermoviolaceus]GGV74910.1 hypothetical protein GCM10010499_30360 [Streptomyces thermoviolaceus subsp. apingens]
MADARRRLRSGTVVLGSVGLLATALTACSSAPDRRCVDRDSYRYGSGYKLVSDTYCKTSDPSVRASWYYGGKKRNGWVSGGSFTKPGKTSGTGSGSGGSSSGSTSGGSKYGGGYGGVDRGGFGGGHGSSGG